MLPSKPVAVGCNSVSVLQGAVMAPDSLPADTFRVRAELTVLTQKRPVIVLVLGTTPPDPSADPCAQFSDKDQFVLLYRSGESWKVQLQNKGECTLPTSPDAITAVETDTKLLVQVNRDGPELSMTWKEDGGAWSPLSHLVSTLGSDAKLSLVAYHPANTKTEQNSVHLTKLSLCPQGD